MKKIAILLLIFFASCKSYQAIKVDNPLKHVTIYQDGKEFLVKDGQTPIPLKNKEFSIRFYVKKVENENKNSYASKAKLAFIDNKDAYIHTGDRKGEDENCFSPGSSCAWAILGDTDTYRKFFINDAIVGFRGNHSLPAFTLNDLSSKNEGWLRKELVVSNIDKVNMKDFFLENLYLVLYPKNDLKEIDKTLMTKIHLRFPDYKDLKTYPEDHFDLKNLNFKTFNANTFYKDALVNNRIRRDSMAENGGGFHEGNLERVNNRKPLFSYSKSLEYGNTITYDNLVFPTMEVLTNDEGELMAVFAENHRNDLATIKKVITYLSEESKVGYKYYRNTRTKQDILQWKYDDKIVLLKIKPVSGFDDYKSKEPLLLAGILIANAKFEERLQMYAYRNFYINYK